MSQPSKEEALFGRIALHNKIITQDQYKECLALRMKTPGQDFGSLLKAKGYVNERQYASIRKAQEKHIMKNGVDQAEASRLARGGIEEGAAPAPAAMVEEFSPADDEPAPEPSSQPTPAPAPKPGGGHGHLGAAHEEESFPHVERPGQDAKTRQAMMSLLKKARSMGASDLHMSCGAKPFLRLHGAIVPFKSMAALTDITAQKYISSIMTDRQWDHFSAKNDWDGSVDLGPVGRFRTNILRQRRGVSAVYRVIKDKVPLLKDLGMPEDLERFTTFHQGLVLVTGATGSGKSSTLAALVELINSSRKDHIITLEDPVEFIFESKQCNVTQRQVELHTRSWGNALRAALREDPDVIMIGEMRDLDTVRLAISAAETGHLVFGTLHTTNATRTIDRVLDVFPPAEQSQIRAMVSESLKGVISQTLVPRADGKGRVVAYELLFTTPAVSHLIRERRTFQLFSVMQTGKKAGMRLMDDSLRELLKQGVITKDSARKAATNPKLFK